MYCVISGSRRIVPMDDATVEGSGSLMRGRSATVIQADFTENQPLSTSVVSGLASATFSLDTMTNGTEGLPSQNSVVSTSAQAAPSTSFKRTIPLKGIHSACDMIDV